MEDWIAVFDIKAFYASFECVERNLDPFTTPLAVTDISRKESTIVLSVSPYLKSLGVPSRCRRRDIPKNIKNLIFATPQMEKYVKKSAEIISIFLDYVGEDDIHVYSIDECFINLSPYLLLYKKTPLELCKEIQKTIYNKTKLICTCGIGPNMFLAKVADDKEAKNNKDYIAIWKKEDIPSKLWPIKPLKELWGISNGYQRRLNNLGIYSVYDLAHYDKNILVSKLGIMGEELWNNANGIDETNIRIKYTPKENALSLGQNLMRDYTKDEAPLIIKEMVDDLSSRLRSYKLKCSCVHLFIRYSFIVEEESFSHQMKLMRATNFNEELYESIMYIYKKYIKDFPIRQIGITYSNLSKDNYTQLSLFEDENKLDENKKMYESLDKIQASYGKNSLTRTSALKKESTAKIRHEQIGGHKK